MNFELDLVLAGCLRRLLKNRFILKTKSEIWYRNIVDKKASIDEFMSAMAAKLVIHDELGIIYIRDLDPETEEKIAYQLGSKITLKKFATHALLIMRKKRSDYFLNPDSAGVCFISKQELKELLVPFLEQFDRYREDKKFEQDLRDTIRELRDLQVIFETAEGSEVYEISPVCEVLLPLEEIQKLEMHISSYMKSGANLEANIN